MEDALARARKGGLGIQRRVLILVVMEDALALILCIKYTIILCKGLNPCCNGRCTRTKIAFSN